MADSVVTNPIEGAPALFGIQFDQFVEFLQQYRAEPDVNQAFPPGPDIIPISHEVTLLHIAALRRHVEAFQALLSWGANPYYVPAPVSGPFLTAFEAAAMLLRAAADLVPEPSFSTRAEALAFFGNLTEFQTYTSGLHAQVGTEGLRSQLGLAAHFAAAAGYISILEVLFAIDAPLLDTVSPVMRLHPVHCAVANKQLETVKWIVVHSDAATTQGDVHDKAAIHWAARDGHVEILHWLINSANCDPNVESADGDTPLLWGARKGHLPVVRYLIEKCGVSATQSSEMGESVLVTACRKGHMHILTWLIAWFKEHDVDIEEELNPTDTLTPLEWACRAGHLEVMKWLHDQHLVSLDVDGGQAVACAAESGCVKAIAWYLNTMDISEFEHQEITLKVALWRRHYGLASWLFREGGFSPLEVDLSAPAWLKHLPVKENDNANPFEKIRKLQGQWSYGSHRFFPKSFQFVVCLLVWAARSGGLGKGFPVELIPYSVKFLAAEVFGMWQEGLFPAAERLKIPLRTPIRC